MTRIAILGDLHLSARNASSHFSRHFNKFFDEVFYPYMIEHNIKEVIQLGDLFDNRTSLSVKAYHACKDSWFQPLVDNDIHMTVLLGNHDVFYKSSLSINTPELILANEYRDNITIVNKPVIKDYFGTQIAIVPWICDENKEEIFKFFKSDKMSNVDICCGHFEIDGFEMMRGIPGHGGLPKDLFGQFELTLSGHYHTKSYDDFYHIQYVGTPYEITFADLNDPRGFHVFDTDTRKLEFIYNPNTMFERLIYNEGCAVDVDKLKDKSVKLVVEKKTDLYEFDRFVDSVKLAGCYDLQIIENFAELHNVNVVSDVKMEDSNSIIEQYIDSLTTNVDKQRLKDYIKGLYVEAISK